MPLKEFGFFDSADQVYDYLPWKCNDYSELDTTEEESTDGRQPQSGGVVADDHGFGDVDESAWEFKPPSQ